DEAIVDEKDKIKPATWFNRGELLQDIHDVNIEFLRLGMMDSEAVLILGEPDEKRTKEEGNILTEEHVYKRITLTYKNGVLTEWKETQVIHPDPLPEALNAYIEALKLDKKVKENLELMKLQAEGDAILDFTRKDYVAAVEKFELILDISKTDVFNGFIDTIIIYNAALASRSAGNHEEAAQYFERSAELSYGGSDTYYLLKTEYISLKDSTKALDALERGYAIYPDSTLIIFELVNYHLQSGNSEEGMRYLQEAEKIAGDNPSIYFAKGTLFERLGDPDGALKAYEQALEADPEFFNAWFNIGALYFNKAVAMYDKANLLEDLDEYNKAKELADEELKKSVPPLEKAHEIDPKDKDCLLTLKTIYYRLQMTEKMDAVEAELDNLE
ncbi:tetratricopeptide repeat protein, partial [Bacteroidota bacterium]